MAATKQFLLNYDSNILLPYTTLDCILGKEDDDPNAAKTTGIDVITDNLLKNIKDFIYNSSENGLENQINGGDISKAYVLGISTLREGGSQVYTKFHELTLDSSAQAGQYLGADGTTHDIKFAAEDKHAAWYSTSINVKPSIRLDNPISADVSININVSGDCFEIREGHLYSKYSTDSTKAVFSQSATYANTIATVSETSTGASFKVISIGPNIPVQLNDGNLTAIKDKGEPNQPIYINPDGEITEFYSNIGTSIMPVYLNNGKFVACDANTIGSSDQPMYYDPSQGGFTACNGKLGANDTLGYIENGVYKTSSLTAGTSYQPIYVSNGKIYASSGDLGGDDRHICMKGGILQASNANLGSDDAIPTYISGGIIKAFSNKVPTYTGNGTVGSNIEASTGGVANPVYIEEGVVKGITATVCSTTSNQLISLTNGTFQKQTGAAGSSKKPVYVADGIIKPCSDNVGDEQTPVYISGGTFTECSLDPTSIEDGAVSTQAGTWYLLSENGDKRWAKGNTTTSGDFTIDPSTAYYVVGVAKGNYNSQDTAFTHLTGAKSNTDTGIYFKNYELFQTSDENLKTFTDEIDINFDNLATIKKGIYYWTDDPNKISDIGIGARSLEALYPEIVDENEGVKTVAYNRLGVIALAAIDKLHLRVRELETEMKELKAEIRALKQGK